jgi:hypothetical protein
MHSQNTQQKHTKIIEVKVEMKVEENHKLDVKQVKDLID